MKFFKFNYDFNVFIFWEWIVFLGCLEEKICRKGVSKVGWLDEICWCVFSKRINIRWGMVYVYEIWFKNES